jgi:hypothetical protein
LHYTSLLRSLFVVRLILLAHLLDEDFGRRGRQARRELLNAKLRVRQAWLQQDARPEVLSAVIQRGRKTVQVNLTAIIDEVAPGSALAAARDAFYRPQLAGSTAERCAAFLADVEAALAALGPA